MSKQAALEFLRQATADKAAQDRMREATFEALARMARSAGYYFNLAEYKAALAQFKEEQALAQDEVPEDVLDMIAGGTGFGQIKSEVEE
jgi:hypothetical protein